MENINDIIDGIKKGDNENYKLIIEEYYKEIYTYVYRKISYKNEVEDIVQDIFIKAYYNLNKFSNKISSFRTWLHKVATNYCIDYFRSKQFQMRLREVSLELDISNNEDILLSIIKNERIEYLIKIIESVLNKKHRKIMYLHFFSDLNVNEIANSLNISNKSIYRAIDLSINKIKKRLSGEWNE